MTRREAALLVLSGETVGRATWSFCRICGSVDFDVVAPGFGVVDVFDAFPHPPNGILPCRTRLYMNVGLFIGAGLRALHESSP